MILTRFIPLAFERFRLGVIVCGVAGVSGTNFIMKTVIAKQNPEAPVAVEVMAESIVAISQGIKKLLAGPLKEEALLLLITNAAPAYGPRYRRQSVTRRDVKAVLDGLASLEKTYIKPCA